MSIFCYISSIMMLDSVALREPLAEHGMSCKVRIKHAVNIANCPMQGN